MKLKFSKIKSKRGFSLVECVVAIGIFAIMSAMLVMMMGITIKMRTKNMTDEAGIDDQVANIAGQTNLSTDAFSGKIDFGANGEIEVDGSHVKANKIYTDDANMQVGALKYDFTGYAANVIANEGGESGYGATRIYGADDISGNVAVTCVSDTHDEAAGIHTIRWRVEYTLNAISDSACTKIVLPIGASFSGMHTNYGTGLDTMVITDRAVRLTSTYAGAKRVEFDFVISDADFASYYRSFGNYMKNKLEAADPLQAINTVSFSFDASADSYKIN